MPLKLTRANQADMLESAMRLNFAGINAWCKDAIAFGAIKEGESDPSYIAVFQHFADSAADVVILNLSTLPITEDVVGAYTELAFHPRILGLAILVATVDQSNIQSQISYLKAGFQFEYRKRPSVTGDEGAIVMSMYP
jgi:hypothetical protein